MRFPKKHSGLSLGLILISLLFVTGCVNYKAVGKFDNNSEVLIGNVNHNLMTGGGKYELTSVSTGISCNGVAKKPDRYPPFGLCAGQEGDAIGACSDGRRLDMRWYATSCTTGYGMGSASDGNAFRFTFGLSKEEALDALNRMLDEVETSKASDAKSAEKLAEEECLSLGRVAGTDEFRRCVLEKLR